jgi:ElaB/YqjD/DUF883 family membrane-anchored ribosome-binding protein
MASATVDTGLGAKATDVYRKATHLADEARDAINRGIANAEDFRDTAVYRVKRNPLKAVGLAFGAGLLLGAVFGALGRRRRE